MSREEQKNKKSRSSGAQFGQMIVQIIPDPVQEKTKKRKIKEEKWIIWISIPDFVKLDYISSRLFGFFHI